MSRNGTLKRRNSFSRLTSVIDLPDLLDVQLCSFEEFLQNNVPPSERENKGLQAVFTSVFPIMDSRENFLLEFIEYYIERPKTSVAECQERGITYSAPLKAKLRLSVKDDMGSGSEVGETTEQ